MSSHRKRVDPAVVVQELAGLIVHLKCSLEGNSENCQYQQRAAMDAAACLIELLGDNPNAIVATSGRGETLIVGTPTACAAAATLRAGSIPSIGIFRGRKC